MNSVSLYVVVTVSIVSVWSSETTAVTTEDQERNQTHDHDIDHS